METDMEFALTNPEAAAVFMNPTELALAGLKSHFENQTGNDQIPFTD